MAKVKRKQAELPGMERHVEHPDVEDAAKAYCEVRDQRSALSKKEKLAKLTLIATMHANKLVKYEYQDDSGEILEVEAEQGEWNVVVRKTGDMESEIGEGVSDGEQSDAQISQGGLIAKALKAQADAGVTENEDGDVVPRDDPPAKKKRRKSGARS